MEIYTGYIVAEDETNPYSVWVPAKNNGGIFKRFKTFASNAGDFNGVDLSIVQSSAEKCYMIIEPTAQSPYLYDNMSGLATIEENNPSPDINTVKNVKNMSKPVNRYFTPHHGESDYTPHSNPAANGLQTYLPGSFSGTEINTFMNAPGGRHTTLGIGTKVLIVYPDGRGTGYIIGQIPFPDDTSKVLKDILG